MFDSEVRLVIEQTLLVYAALFPIVNPVGGAPVFLAMTRGISDEARRVLARRIAINAFLLVLASMILGSYVIEFFGLSVPIIQIGGGALVCSVAWALLRSDDNTETATVGATHEELAARAFYPMTLPLTVGPGSIAVAITLGAQAPQRLGTLALIFTADAIGALLLALTIYVLYRNAQRLARRLGVTGTVILLRLSAFILLCIGVQIVWNGVFSLLQTVPPVLR